MGSIQRKFCARLKVESEKAQQMSRLCTKLHFIVKPDPWMLGVDERIQVREFLGNPPPPPLPLRQVSIPEATEEADVGRLPKCLHMAWNLIILLCSFRQFTHDLPEMHTDNLPYSFIKLRHTWMLECVLGVCLWLKATRRGEAFPDLVQPRGISANRHGQTVISCLKAWKYCDHLTRKRQDFWTFDLPLLPSTLLLSVTTTTADR